MEKTGILGGTFNPIHNGHIAIGLNAIEEFNLDKILFIPTGISYFKLNTDIVDKRIRLEMTRLIEELNDKFYVSDIEVNRDGYSYTADTIKELLDAGEDDLYYIIGADTLFSIEKWRNPEYILENVTVICTVRDDFDYVKVKEKALFLEKEYNTKILISNMKPLDISSSKIRNHIKDGKINEIKSLVPPKIFDYIIDNKLYI